MFTWTHFFLYYLVTTVFVYGYSRAQRRVSSNIFIDNAVELFCVVVAGWLLWPYILFNSSKERNYK